MSNKVYDILKFCALVLFPALGTLYFTLAGIWDLPNPEGVTGTILAIDTFLGVILGITASSYNKSDARYDGDAILTTDPGGISKYSLELNKPAEDMLSQSEVRFKVVEVKEDPLRNSQE